MTTGSAYSSNNTTVLDAWTAYLDYVQDVRARRSAMQDLRGRKLVQQRMGFGHGSRITGFEALDGERLGDVIGEDRALRVAKTGPLRGYAVPALSRKAGKDLAAELTTLNDEGPNLPGMPTFVFSGLRILAPALHEREGVVWAFWGDNQSPVDDQVDHDLWQPQPLSAYYADREARDAKDAETAGASA